MSQQIYTMCQEADQTWSVLIGETEVALRLAGIPQTGLSKVEAEIMLELLAPRSTGLQERTPISGPAALLTRAAA